MNKHEFDGEEGLEHVGEDDVVSAYYAAAAVCVLTVRSQGLGHMLTIVPN